MNKQSKAVRKQEFRRKVIAVVAVIIVLTLIVGLIMPFLY